MVASDISSTGFPPFFASISGMLQRFLPPFVAARNLRHGEQAGKNEGTVPLAGFTLHTLWRRVQSFLQQLFFASSSFLPNPFFTFQIIRLSSLTGRKATERRNVFLRSLTSVSVHRSLVTALFGVWFFSLALFFAFPFSFGFLDRFSPSVLFDSTTHDGRSSRKEVLYVSFTL